MLPQGKKSRHIAICWRFDVRQYVNRLSETVSLCSRKVRNVVKWNVHNITIRNMHTSSKYFFVLTR